MAFLLSVFRACKRRKYSLITYAPISTNFITLPLDWHSPYTSSQVDLMFENTNGYLNKSKTGWEITPKANNMCNIYNHVIKHIVQTQYIIGISIPYYLLQYSTSTQETISSQYFKSTTKPYPLQKITLYQRSSSVWSGLSSVTCVSWICLQFSFAFGHMAATTFSSFYWCKHTYRYFLIFIAYINFASIIEFIC